MARTPFPFSTLRSLFPSQAVGIDVGFYQRGIDWAAARDGGVDFALLRCAQGHYQPDSFFQKNVKRAAEEGVVSGSYFVAVLDDDGTPTSGRVQALRFIDHGGCGLSLPPMLDLETSRLRDGISLKSLAWTYAWVADFLATIYEDGRRTCGLYLSHRGAKLFGAAEFMRLIAPRTTESPLLWWASYYKPASLPAIYAPQIYPADAGWGIWQVSSDGVVPGIQPRCDLNVFNGSVDDLRRRVI